MYNLQLTAEEVKERLHRVQRLSADVAVHSALYDSATELIRIDLGYTVEDGSEIKFKSPVSASATTGLIAYYPDADGVVVSTEFAFADAHGNNVGAVDHLFAENAVVKVILDLDTNNAFVQNADTNKYLEDRFADIDTDINDAIEYVDNKVADMVDSAPETLNTLNELAKALGEDPNFATTVATQIGNKVDKVDGKGLSTNDYTTAEKDKLANIAEGANKTIVDDTLSADSTNPVQNKVVNTAISNLNTLVGDKPVSEQIATAVEAKMDKNNPAGTGSFSLNRKTDTTIGNYSFAAGMNTTASGEYSLAEGYGTTASGIASHAEGAGTTASSAQAHAEGVTTIASGNYSHAEGNTTEASGESSHAEGSGTLALGNTSHSEGDYTKAFDHASHAEGYCTEAHGIGAHAEGYSTIAAGVGQHVQGKYNIEDEEDIYAHIIGNGGDDESRSNAHTIDWQGNANFAGDVYVGNANENKAGKKLATEDYVAELINNLHLVEIVTWETND